MNARIPLSVVVCAHNPRRAYLDRVLRSLREQTLRPDAWELVLVDNDSRDSIADVYDLSWHVRSRHIAESKLGLTPARMRGIAESGGETIVFVDDDNVLDRDYLEVALRIAAERPWIGAWGGRVEPEFEVPPPAWLSPYLPMLAVNEVPTAQWSNYANPCATPPSGAGMCVRRSVAEAWVLRRASDPRLAALGRTGTSLASSEDIDLAFTACDLGLGTGRFPELRLLHLIPKERVELGYVLRLIENVIASQILMRSLRENLPAPPAPSLFDRIRELWRDWRRDPISRQICAAERRGRALGHAQVAALQ